MGITICFAGSSVASRCRGSAIFEASVLRQASPKMGLGEGLTIKEKYFGPDWVWKTTFNCGWISSRTKYHSYRTLFPYIK